MKNTILILATLFLITSCCDSRNDILKTKNAEDDYYLYGIIVFDSCEYIKVENHSEIIKQIIHKGNCKYCAKRIQQSK